MYKITFSAICNETICNEPLSRVGSFAPSVGLLTRSSLFGDGPVSTGALTFRSVSRFTDGMATTKQQTMDIYFIRQSETRVDDDTNTNTLLATSNHDVRTTTTVLLLRSSCIILHTVASVSSSSFSAGKISLARRKTRNIMFYNSKKLLQKRMKNTGAISSAVRVSVKNKASSRSLFASRNLFGTPQA
ncbi:hypothetical protein T08_5878 [Trichinella sp. T8]|nr:hypothetical protein T08_5878 [Trichinella sp. T8]